MMKRLLKRLRTALAARANRVLSTIPEDSGAVVLHDTEAIHQVVRKGDVILIEGRERLSQLIRLFNSEFQVICSGSIARAFQRVGVLVRPTPIGSYHPSWITPRDFDLSPNFEIIKA